MNGSHHRRVLSCTFFAVVTLAACTTRSTIGDQQGTGGLAGTQGPSTGGTGGTWGSAGTSGQVSGGGAGSPGAAGSSDPAGSAGVSGAAGASGDPGSGGTLGSAGTGSGSAGTQGSAGVSGDAGNTGAAGSTVACGDGAGGQGMAALMAPIEYETHRYGGFAAIGDLNGDGKPDLVAANYFYTDHTGISAAAGRPAAGDGGSLSVFLSAPGGGLAAPRHYGLTGAASSIAVGDLNADGKADVVVVNQQGVGVWINDGTGALLDREVYSTGVEPYAVAIGDLNGDGKADVAIANRGYSPLGDTDGDVAVLLTVGQNPRFSAVNYPAGKRPVHVAIGDLNGDGKPDLAVSNSANVVVLTNSGGGAFGAPANFGAGTNPTSSAIGDLNGDGKLDLVLSRDGITAGAGVLLNAGNGQFAPAILYNVPSTYNVAIGDVTGDGKPDLIGTLGVGVVSRCGAITFAPNNGNGSFGDSRSFSVSVTTGPVTVGDLDGDGRPDVAVPNVEGVAVLLNAAH